jgi:serine/threonine protein phosphatase PrpC
MEDAHTIIQNMHFRNFVPVQFYAVYDGHGGYNCSQYLRKTLHMAIKEELE